MDDFIFFSIRKEYLHEYNKTRKIWRRRIEENGGKLQRGGRHWYKGGCLPSDQVEEFAEDMTEPLKDLTASHSDGRDISQTYTMEDVNKISERLGIP